MLPQATFPAPEGDLEITDGNESVVIPGCKIDSLQIEQNESGTIWSLAFSDRRWRWRDLGAVSGCYNQLDPHGKLVPWTIRSPTELAILCLEALGEINYVLNLPAGLDSSAGLITSFLPNGLNFPLTGTNPLINWDAVPPAALQQLADQFGCRIVYQLSTDSVLVTPAGIGAVLPPGSLARQGPSLKDPGTPDAVGVTGAPTRYQVRLHLQPVGEEWDGSYRPIDDLSYAPVNPGAAGAVQISTATSVNAFANSFTGNGLIYQVFLDPKNGPNPVLTGTLLEYDLQHNDNDTDVAQGLVAAFEANVKAKLAVSFVGGILTVQGTQVGVPFSMVARISGNLPLPGTTFGPALVAQMAQLAGKATSWDASPPPLFPGVVATDRLTLPQALDLARKTVWKLFQVEDVDANLLGGLQPILVPGYGRLKRRQQLVLQDTQVDQIVPQALDGKLRDTAGQPLVINYYNGYSKDKPAAVYGSVMQMTRTFGGIIFPLLPFNSAPGSQVFVPFTIDPVWQLVAFSDHVYFYEDGRFTRPFLALQTAVAVRDADTNQIVRFQQIVPLPGQNAVTLPRMELHEDIQVNVTTLYGPTNNLLAVTILETDPYARASFYLAGLAAQYRFADAQTVEYNGIRVIDLDGAIQQVSWSVGAGGAFDDGQPQQ